MRNFAQDYNLMISSLNENKNISAIADAIEANEHIVIVTHQAPDGDAIGSSLALQGVLSSLGKDVRIIIPDMMLASLRALPGAKEIVDATRYAEFAQTTIADADLIFALDFNGLKRIGRLGDHVGKAKATKVMIDHHPQPDDFADIVISHPEISSTCHLVFKVICALGLFTHIDKAAAQCILAGMMTDTGNFSYNCNDPELYTVTAELIKCGADKEYLYRLLFESHSEWCLRLNAYAMYHKMEVFGKEGAALITLTRDELNRFHYVKGDTEGLVNRPLAIPEVKYSCFMREEDGYVKVSMRSLGSFPVNELCREHFGGGGHVNAAGGEFKGTLKDAADLFRSLLKVNKELYLGNHISK